MQARHVVPCGLLLLAVACSVTQRRSLVPESSDAVALVVEEPDGAVSIWRIDGRSVREPKSRRRAELEVGVGPGRHEVECSFASSSFESTQNALLGFDAKPGERYTVMARHVKQGFWTELGKRLRTGTFWPAKGSWVAWIEDSSGTVVAGVRPSREGLFRTELPDGDVATHAGRHYADPVVPPYRTYFPPVRR